MSTEVATCPGVRRRFVWWRAVLVGVLTAVVVGGPTDVLETPYFTRMTPVRGWEFPLLAATVLLAALWAGLPGPARGAAGVSASGAASALAIGCPVCNKLVVGLLGVSGAFGVWAPIQPVLGGLSVVALGLAVALRWRRGPVPSACPVPAAGARAGDHASVPDPAGSPRTTSVE